jgi:membrane associated rhomboid family serine protease
MFLPYRAKNPPERFPWVTISLIAINTLIFACTSEYFLEIREGVVKDWALSHNNFSVVRLFSSMFLHGDIMHLLGNMLFLWIFGAAVEGRLGHIKYLLLYLAAGISGDILHDVAAGVLNPNIPTIGASGAIMGMMGAYLYLFPFAQISIAYMGGFGMRWRAGVVNWHAQWVILLYLGQDLLSAFLFRSTGLSGGVANFAHLGGAALGFVVPLLARMKRDTEDFSDVQAMRTDVGSMNLMVLSLPELQTLMEGASDDVRIVMAFCHKASGHHSGGMHKMCFAALIEHKDLLFTQGDTETLARIIFALPEDCGRVPTAYEMRLASRLEQDGAYDLAVRMYRRIISVEPPTSDTEMALVRLARLTEQINPDKGQAAAIYTELLRLFPNGPQAAYAQTALRRLGPPTIVFSAGKEAVSTAVPIPEGLAIVQSAGHASEETPPTVAPTPLGGISLGAVGNTPIVQPAYVPHDTEEAAPAPQAVMLTPIMTLTPIGAPKPEEQGDKTAA